MKTLCLFFFLLIPSLVAGQTTDSLEIIDFVICKDVLDREPHEPVQSFTIGDERGWSFARIRNDGEMIRVVFVWILEDEEYFRLPVRVGKSPSWRTYSSVSLQPGMWRVELRKEDESLLKEIRFHVSE